MHLRPDASLITELRPFFLLSQSRLPHCPFRGLLEFTRVLARMVAKSPKATLLRRSASVHFVTSMPRRGRFQPEQ